MAACGWRKGPYTNSRSNVACFNVAADHAVSFCKLWAACMIASMQCASPAACMQDYQVLACKLHSQGTAPALPAFASAVPLYDSSALIHP